MYPIYNYLPGWQACNLTEINGKWCSSKENFLDACRASAIIGTLQAGYTDLKYFEQTSIDILENEALLGCSITGWMDNPEILFDPAIQDEGAELILKVNAEVAELLGINPAARTTCVKPSGTTSCLLGTASGIHPHHAKRYIRRVQANVNEFCLQVTEEKNPLAVEPSVWGVATKDRVISFLCEVPPGSVVKNQLDAIDLLEKVKLTQKHWVEKGTRNRDHVVRHNVSNTITVRPHEWKLVEDFIFDNQEWFAGVSLLSSSGDLDYAQAPFATVLTPAELVKEYGDASVFASGLIVAAVEAFDDNLWTACDSALGLGEEIVWPLKFELQEPELPVKPESWLNRLICRVFALEKPLVPRSTEFELAFTNFQFESKRAFRKKDWIRRLKQFAERYFKGDIRHATHCLKHVSLWKTWCDLSREYVEIDWSECHEDTQAIIAADTLAATACSGGACELK
jgi:ribonucleoside-diphosphate reductase alpha chain